MDAVTRIEEFQRFGSILGLERISVLLERLGNPHKDLKVIHVAGTNGKGSICKYIYEALRENGYSVGLFTSPFIEIFNERIELDGKYISDEDLEKYSNMVLAEAAKMEESPTEFEVITAIMFLYFKDKNPDYVVLEVGLGGRGDSTNVIEKPVATVIASISFDHTDRLGNTLTEIAFEKAGIIKAGVPCICAAESAEAIKVIEDRCNKLGSPLTLTKNIPYELVKEELTGYTFNVLGYEDVTVSMIGTHQIKNAIAALATLRLFDLDDEKVKAGLAKAKQMGRLEVLRDNIILDGAHNPDGARMLAETINHHFKGKRILMVTGILADKDVDSILDSFRKITKDFVCTQPDNPRKLDAQVLASKLGGKAFIDYKDAVDYALSRDYDLVLISGSLYLIGAVRRYINDKAKA
ncbi:MAG: bifunctional folylpolyglutamate synthase/dihydrofolate synthase [Clostridia bacterium]|nr:bifunctional folylpolyglutamate synthase/dihydrofolate synthase [Clostridia bacterium]